MKEFEIMFGDLKPEKQDKFLTEMISVIKEEYDIDIYHSYDYALDSLRIRMIDKNDNNINGCISYHDLCIITVDHFKYLLEEMAKQLPSEREGRIRTEVTLRCPHCGNTVVERNSEEAVIAWNHYHEGEKEENGMKDILELVSKIEELLKKSKFEWFMTYDPKEKAWTFQFKEK